MSARVHEQREDTRRQAVMSIEQDMPPGTQFVYLGRPCVVLRWADISEARHSENGWFGLVMEYADAHGVIRQHCIAPRDLDGFSRAMQRVPS